MGTVGVARLLQTFQTNALTDAVAANAAISNGIFSWDGIATVGAFCVK
jgi:hypothetical protein